MSIPKPLNEYVIVTEEKEEKTEQGIFIPKDTGGSLSEYHTGIVAALPLLPDDKKSLVKVGDKILYKHYRNIRYEGYEFIKFDDMVCITKKTA